MQMIILNGDVICPACSGKLTKLKEQDRRVHVMEHPDFNCSLRNRQMRVDRLNGYSELYNEA